MDKKSETTPTLTGEDVEGCEDAVERLSVGQILHMQEDKGLEEQEWREAWKHQEPHIFKKKKKKASKKFKTAAV